MTSKVAPYLAAAAIALTIPASAMAQTNANGPANDPAKPPAASEAPAQPSINAPAERMDSTPAPTERLAPLTPAAPSRDSSAATRELTPGATAANPPLAATELKGKTVFDAAGKKVGSVDEVIPQSGQTRDAIVKVGGILGIGAKKVLIPASDIARADDGRLVVAMSESQIGSLPEYERPKIAPSSDPASSYRP